MTNQHAARPNKPGWRWLLARYLLKGELEAVPVLPRRPIYPHEVLILKMGEEGAFNTVEVKSLVHHTTELVPMTNGLEQDAAPNTFIAVDVRDFTRPPDNYRRVVGTFVNLSDSTSLLMMVEVQSLQRVDIPIEDVIKAYWAPMGYRWKA